MKVFVEMPEDGLYYKAFAFFDTVTNTFDSWGGSQHWETFRELTTDMFACLDPIKGPIDEHSLARRYKSLLPARYGGDLP